MRLLYSNDGGIFDGIWCDGKPFEGTATKFKLGVTVYTGQLMNGQRHGSGKAKYTNGDVYEGNWDNGCKEGTGSLTQSSSGKFVGEWRNDLPWEGQMDQYHCKDGKYDLQVWWLRLC